MRNVPVVLWTVDRAIEREQNAVAEAVTNQLSNGKQSVM